MGDLEPLRVVLLLGAQLDGLGSVTKLKKIKFEKVCVCVRERGERRGERERERERERESDFCH